MAEALAQTNLAKARRGGTRGRGVAGTRLGAGGGESPAVFFGGRTPHSPELADGFFFGSVLGVGPF